VRALDAALARAKDERRGALAPFLVLGDPDLDTGLALLEALAAAEPDLLELGLPFSDPPADGPIIQAADQRALAAGVTTASAFALLARLRERSPIPISLLAHANPILAAGTDAFYRRAREVGVDAVLVADVPLEEAGPFVASARRYGVAPVFVATPLTPASRLAELAALSESYVYVLAQVGVTGERVGVSPRLSPLLASLRRRTALPLLAGFGIRGPDEVRGVIEAGADGAIVGSALVRLVAEAPRAELPGLVRARTAALVEAARGARPRRDPPSGP
jgi:tryptophan synthase alpha chain